MRLAFFLAALLLAAGCDSAGPSGPPGPSGSSNSFDVVFRDTSGAEVSRATLVFDRPDAGAATEGTYGHVSGSRIASSEALRATGLADGTVRVALDVGVADGGTELVGPFSRGASGGTWSSGSFAGPVPRGTFRAEGQ